MCYHYHCRYCKSDNDGQLLSVRNDQTIKELFNVYSYYTVYIAKVATPHLLNADFESSPATTRRMLLCTSPCWRQTIYITIFKCIFTVKRSNATSPPQMIIISLIYHYNSSLLCYINWIQSNNNINNNSIYL